MSALAFIGVALVLPDGTRLFEGLDLSVAPGQVVAVSTPLGGGKSSLLRMAVGLAGPSEGSVRVLGADPAAPDPDGVFRRRIGYVPREGALLSNLMLFDNLVLPLRWHADLAPDAVRLKAAAALAEFGVESLPRIQPPQAGTALRRQVALARALITDPEVLILDEPGAELDEGNANEMWRNLVSLALRRGIAVLASAPADPRVRGVDHHAVGRTAAATRSWRASNLQPAIKPER